MRLFILCIFTVPIVCFALEPEACHFEGTVNKRVIKLEFDGGSNGYLMYSNLLVEEYKYCKVFNEDGGPAKIVCSKQNEGAISVVYKRQSKKLSNGTYVHPFVCIENCSSGVVNTFHQLCQDEGE